MNFPENPAYIESNPLVIKQSNDVVGIRTGDYKYFRDKNDPKMRIHLFAQFAELGKTFTKILVQNLNLVVLRKI